MRKLASIQKIKSLDAIPGADRVEVAQIQGWQVVVQKGLYKAGDLVVYFEIDSLLPAKKWCEFMADRKYRVRTIKIRQQVSQGLCMPIKELFPQGYSTFTREGEDVTEPLRVTKYDPESAKELRENPNAKRQSVPHAWMLKFNLTRILHQKMYPQMKGAWPRWMPKTDETRVQNLSRIDDMVLDRSLYYSEKLDGQSVTFFYVRDEKVGLFKKGLFGVCSRNIWYKTPASNNWWNMAKGLEMKERLSTFCDVSGRSLALQGELIGPGIQKNRYKKDEQEVYFFNVWDIDAECYVPLKEKLEILSALGLDTVPICSLTFVPPTGYDYVAAAEGKSLMEDRGLAVSKKGLGTIEREGLVFRDVLDDGFSFKAISNKFLLKEEKR